MTASIAEITEPVALISGPRLRENYRKLRELAGTDVLAVVKANAYGHGAIEVSRCLAEIGCPFFKLYQPDTYLRRQTSRYIDKMERYVVDK